MSEPVTTSVKDQTQTEWWVCCYREDVDHHGSVDRVPAASRFVACKNEFGDGPKWSLAGCLHGPENHWIVPITKVELA